jgi:hypothetical protein
MHRAGVLDRLHIIFSSSRSFMFMAAEPEHVATANGKHQPEDNQYHLRTRCFHSRSLTKHLLVAPLFGVQG